MNQTVDSSPQRCGYLTVPQAHQAAMDDRTARPVPRTVPQSKPSVTGPSNGTRGTNSSATTTIRSIDTIPTAAKAWLRPRRSLEATTEAHAKGDRRRRDREEYRNRYDQVAPVLRARNHTGRRPRRNEVTRDLAVVRLRVIVCSRSEPREMGCSHQGEGTHYTHREPRDLDPGMGSSGIASGFRRRYEILTARRPGHHPVIFTQGISRFPTMTAARKESQGQVVRAKTRPTGRSTRGTRPRTQLVSSVSRQSACSGHGSRPLCPNQLC